MSLGFNSDQYNQAFDPKRLQNWEIPRCHRERPDAKEGYTQFIANDKGCLKPDVRRSRENPWGTYVPTWDMPLRLPGPKCDNPTSRTARAHDLLSAEKRACHRVLSGKEKVPRDKAQSTGRAKQARLPCGAKTFPEEPTRSGAENPMPPTQQSPLPRESSPDKLPTPTKAMSPVPM